ncbi:MAG: putative DNA binding domain-containing protein [Conchiformibius sp.]|nr:putative DNA binding domain-containing protein [Conchiformibius sp.]
MDYSLSTLVMRDVTNEIVDEVFSRINTYGRRLSDQERRQAGVQTIFANLVRRLSVKIRGDFCYTNGDSILSLLNLDENSISLSQMPEISIDLPRSKFGYGIAAENTFWCKHNILRAQDLRDSADEQCIADIVASIVLNEPLARDKESLDRLYTDNPDASINVRLAGEAAGNKIYDEILFCFERLEALCDRNGKKLRELIGIKESNNSIPALFANILIAMYKLFFEEKKEISDYKLLGSKLIEATKGSVNKKTSDKRNSSINMIKACIDSAFQGEIDMNEVFKSINLNKMEVEVEGIIAQAVEQARFEFKQGCLSLNPSNRMSNQKQFFEKIMHTICAIANTAEHGAIIVGVADTESDAKRIEELDEIQSRAVRSKKVVGIDREARALSTAYKSRERYLEEYMNLWKNQIQNSDLSKELKISVLSSLKYLPYYGLGLIVIDIPKQSNYSCVGDKIYFRCVDSTSKIGDVVVAATHEEIAGVVKKFQ